MKMSLTLITACTVGSPGLRHAAGVARRPRRRILPAPAHQLAELVLDEARRVVEGAGRVVDDPAHPPWVGGSHLDPRAPLDGPVRAVGDEVALAGHTVLVPPHRVEAGRAGVVGRRPQVGRAVLHHGRRAEVAGVVRLHGHDLQPGREAALTGHGAVRDELLAGRIAGVAPDVQRTVVLDGHADAVRHLHRGVGAGRGTEVDDVRGGGRVGPPAAHAADAGTDGTAGVTADAELGEAGRGGRGAEPAGHVAPDLDLAAGVQDAVATRVPGRERRVRPLPGGVVDDGVVAPAAEVAVRLDGARPLVVGALRRPLGDHGVREVVGGVRALDGVGLRLPRVRRPDGHPGAVVVQPRDGVAPERGTPEGLERTDVRQVRDALRLEQRHRHAAGITLLGVGDGHDGHGSDERDGENTGEFGHDFALNAHHK